MGSGRKKQVLAVHNSLSQHLQYGVNAICGMVIISKDDVLVRSLGSLLLARFHQRLMRRSKDMTDYLFPVGSIF